MKIWIILNGQRTEADVEIKGEVTITGDAAKYVLEDNPEGDDSVIRKTVQSDNDRLSQIRDNPNQLGFGFITVGDGRDYHDHSWAATVEIVGPEITIKTL